MSTVQEFLTAWVEAERTCDAEATAALLTEDFVGIGPLGFQLPKSAWLNRLTTGELAYEDLSLDEIAVREYPGFALVTARWNARGTARGNALPTTRATLGLVHQGEDWKLAGIHYSFIAGMPGAPGVPRPA